MGSGPRISTPSLPVLGQEMGLWGPPHRETGDPSHRLVVCVCECVCVYVCVLEGGAMLPEEVRKQEQGCCNL